ncbi:hypothetical protein MPTK2_4g02560 [Marchantia polymorpha subsp. ruderalis]
MDLQRWPVVEPLLPHLVAAAKAGHGKHVLEFFLRRIYNSDGEINSVVESCAPIALEEIRSDSRPFEGLPLLVKDNLHLEGFHTVCGSSVFANNPVAARDSKFVATLRELGAIPIGKTNVPAFCLDLQTFNDVYGTTKNPYNAQLTVGGSSGGSAAAVAMSLAPFAIGNDLNGSLRIPASFCGVCSFHASRGVLTIHQEDIFPRARHIVDPEVLGSILTEGLFTTNVADLQFCMRPLLHSSIKQPHEAFMKRLPQKRRQEVLLGVVTSYSRMLLDHRIDEAMKKIPSWLEEAPQNVGTTKLVARIASDFVLDGKTTHKATRIFSDAAATAKYDFKKLEEARSIQDMSSAAVQKYFETTGFSALIMPVCAVLPPEHNPNQNPVVINDVEVPYFIGMACYVEPVKISGCPVVTMPLCLIDGRPCGVQVVGRMGCDEELLSLCVELERHLASAEARHTHPLKFPSLADFPC